MRKKERKKELGAWEQNKEKNHKREIAKKGKEMKNQKEQQN